MPVAHLDVQWLNRPAIHLHGIEVLGEFQELAQVGERTGTPPANEISTIGRPQNSSRRQVFSPKPHGMVRITWHQRNLAGDRCEGGLDNLSPQSHPAIAFIDAGTKASKDIASFANLTANAYALKDIKGCEINGFYLVVRDQA